jgi:hypothetical protein
MAELYISAFLLFYGRFVVKYLKMVQSFCICIAGRCHEHHPLCTRSIKL